MAFTATRQGKKYECRNPGSKNYHVCCKSTNNRVKVLKDKKMPMINREFMG
jgi:hypothetical protein